MRFVSFNISYWFGVGMSDNIGRPIISADISLFFKYRFISLSDFPPIMKTDYNAWVVLPLLLVGS